MTIAKPGHGTTNWDTSVNAVIDAVNALGEGTQLSTRTLGDASPKLGVPLYIFPDYTSTPSIWNTIASLAPAARFVIANPNTGPGTSSSPYYVEQIKRMQASGVFTLGYVSTHYASVPYATVMADVANWISWYNVDGIFLDETPYNSDQAHYQQIYDAIKALNPNLIVVCNPGIGVDVSMEPTADIFMSFEGAPADYRARPSVNAPAWERTQPAWRFWHLVHSVTGLAEAQEMLELSRTYRAGTVFVTDRVMPNPWLGLPSAAIWQAQCDFVRGAAESLTVNVKDYGAKGDGATDDSAAVAAARDALLSTRNSSGLPAMPVLYFPPGAYTIVSPDTLMNATATTNDFVDGMEIRGAGRGISTIRFRPTGSTATLTGRNLMTWKNTSTGGRVVNFRCADLTFDCNNSAASFLYSYSETTSYNQHVTFDNVEWSGDWNRVVGLDGSDAAANLNSEMGFHNCATFPTTTFADAFFVCGVTPGDTSNQQDQMVNYWFRDCLFAWSSGTLYKFPKGGSISVTGGSYSLLGASCLMFSMPFHHHNAGAQRLLVSDIRLELVVSGARTIDCEWSGGTIEWINLDESPVAWQTWAPTTKAHRYDWGVNNTFNAGPIVTYRGCTLEGYHEIATGSTALATGRIRYDGCVFFNYFAGQLTALTGSSGVLRWTGSAVPAFSFRECTGLTTQMPNGGTAGIGRSVRVYASSTGQTIADGADVAVDVNTTDLNDDTSLYTVDLTANTITVKWGGLFLADATATFSGGGVGERNVAIWVNGAAKRTSSSVPGNTTSWTSQDLSKPIRLATGDVVLMHVYIDGGSTVTLQTGQPFYTGWSLTYLGA